MTTDKTVNADKVIYKDLSYKVVGILFEVYNELGYGYKEKYYEKAISKCFIRENIKFKSQVPYPLTFKGETIGQYYLDFLIDDKIVLEIKKGNYFNRKNIEQVKEYLKVTKMKLAILANFTSNGVKSLRILNA
ncbi:MAG: GxxExxY protein [Patescibacteria group bacterium]|jgi:GxxExxY protein